MYCRKCGKQIDDEAVVCPNCGVLAVRRGAGFYGQPVQPVVQPVQPVQQPVQVTNGQDIPEAKGVNGLGIAGFVVGLLSLFLGFLFCLPAVTGLIISILAVMDVKKRKSCNGLAIAGLVLSGIALAGWFVFFARLFIIMIIFG